MAHRIEKGTNDLVIDGWENGIATSPHKGIGDLKCLNISTMSGEVSVNYARVQQSQVPISAGTITASGNTNFLTYSGTTPLLPGTWVTVAGGSTITNFTSTTGQSSGPSFYVSSVSGTNATFALSFEGSVISNFGTTGTATFTTVNMGKPVGYAYTNSKNFPGYQYFVLDANGLVWENESGSSQWLLIQTTAAAGATTGIFCYGEYVFVAADKLYYKSIAALGTAWAIFKTLNQSGANIPHSSVITPSGLQIICDGSQLDTLTTNPGFSFDPTNTATYTWQSQAVLLPLSDIANTLALIANGSAATGGTGGATNVLVGGLTNQIYPWAPGTSFFQPVIFVSESYIQQMVTVNNLVYIFAGSKGNIYITNGSSVTSVISVPDYIANSTGANQDPFFIWGGAMYLRGRIWFSAQAPNCGGVWSFIPTINYYAEQDTGISLRLEHQNSYGTYAGMATILFAPQKTTDQNAEGVQYWAGWDDGSSGGSSNPYGIDFSGTLPYTNGAAIIESDLIPTGTMLKTQTFSQIEYKLSTPLSSVTATTAIALGATSATLSGAWGGSTGTLLVTFSDGQTRTATFTSGSTAVTWTGGLTKTVTAAILTENVTIKYRETLNSAWASIPTDILMNPSNTAGYFVPGFEFTQWIQFQIILSSTTNNPSYVRFKELRIR